MTHGWQLLRRKNFATLENQRLIETELASSVTFRIRFGPPQLESSARDNFSLLDLLFTFFCLTPRSNALLATLPDSEYTRLEPHLEKVMLHKGQTLFEMGQQLTNVYYPVRAIVSMMLDLPEGVSVEACSFGHADVVGVEKWLG